jgi:hypothetical protein
VICWLIDRKLWTSPRAMEEGALEGNMNILQVATTMNKASSTLVTIFRHPYRHKTSQSRGNVNLNLRPHYG